MELRRRYRSFTFPATIAFMAWYLLYVICANWARDFMDTKVVGNINIALVWGCCSSSRPSPSPTCTPACQKSLDPLASELWDEFEQETGR